VASVTLPLISAWAVPRAAAAKAAAKAVCLMRVPFISLLSPLSVFATGVPARSAPPSRRIAPLPVQEACHDHRASASIP